jgi:hypothetical protein
MQKYRFLLVSLAFLVSCAKYMDDEPGRTDSTAISDNIRSLQPITKERITGLWVRPKLTDPSDEGYLLNDDGSMRVINGTLVGQRWTLSGDTLSLLFNGNISSAYRIERLADTLLTLQSVTGERLIYRRKHFSMPSRFASDYREHFTGTVRPLQDQKHTFIVRSLFDGAVKIVSDDKRIRFTLLKDGFTITDKPAREFSGSFPAGTYTVIVKLSAGNKAASYELTVEEQDIDK